MQQRRISFNKRELIIAVLLMIGGSLFAQHSPMNLPTYDRKPWHFGFTLGFNAMDFVTYTVDREDYHDELLVLEPVSSQGFNIGIVTNIRLADYLDLRFIPTLSFGERRLRYIFMDTLNIVEETYIKSVESTFLDFPLILKYKGKRLPNKLTNIRPYVLAGVRYSLDLSSQKEKKSNNDEVVLKLNPHDFLFELGVGFDFYLKYFKFGIELKMAYGIMNNLHQEDNPFTLNIDKLTSKIMWFTFTFE